MISEKIKELRISKGWNQEQLADRAGVSRAVISRYENGTIPYKRNLKKVLKAFGLPADYFFQSSVADNNISGNQRKYSDDGKLNHAIEDLLLFSKKEQKIVLDVIGLIKRKSNVIVTINYSIDKLSK